MPKGKGGRLRAAPEVGQRPVDCKRDTTGLSMSRRRDRTYYLEDIPLAEATGKFHAALAAAGALGPAPCQTLSLELAHGRVTAGPVWAASSSPHYDSAAMDGVAVRSRETVGATETSPVRLAVSGQAVWIDTGDAMPDGFDAVIKVEVVHEIDAATIEIRASVPPYHDVRPLGEDIAATELVVPAGHRLRPQDLAACAQAGLTEVEVRRAPRVTIIPTGSELVPVGTTPGPGGIIESNSLMLAAMIADWGGHAGRRDPVPDDRERLRAAVSEAVGDSDVVIVNAGSSAGSEDFTARVIGDLGELVVHGVAVKPGHPVALGVVGSTPVLGIPGYAVSAALTTELFVKPIIERKLGFSSRPRDSVRAVMTRKTPSSMGEDEYLRVRLGRVGDRMVATPIQRGAGVVMSLVRADGLAVSPRGSEGFDAGAEVDVELLRPAGELDGAIIVTGSHDLALDLLASELHRLHPDKSLASANVGSLGGLLALSRGEAHLAGCHLLDEETGEYNRPFVRRYLGGRPAVLVNLAHRMQGLIVKPGNPKSIKTLADVVRGDVAFINRQRGSGTRMLLDYLLKDEGIAHSGIQGYEREEYTHLAVAANVAGGRADVGVGILSAARAMGMDFVELGTEQYDLVIPAEFYGSDLLAPLLDLIRSGDFRRQMDALGGYDTSQTGEVQAEL